MKKTSKVQSEHTQSLHYMNIRQFFTCLNCIPPIKFPFAKLDFAVWNTYYNRIVQPHWKTIHTEVNATDSEFFPRNSSAFWLFYE